MADPISIISIIAVAAHSVNKTQQFVESIKGAPEAVKRVAGDLAAIKTPLQDLTQLSSDFCIYDIATRDDIARSLGPAVSSCQDTVTELEDLLKPYVRSDGSARSSAWKRMSFGFKEHKVLVLRSQLEACKSSLNLAAIRVSIIIQNKHRQQTDKTGRDVKRMMRHFEIETSTVADTEYAAVDGRLGYRTDISQWLAETRTVIGEHDQEPWSDEDDVPAPVKKLRLTMQEISKHRFKRDLLVVIHNKVYDVSAFVDEHPGGDEALLDVGGRDATEAFMDVGHSDEAHDMLKEYFIGNLER